MAGKAVSIEIGRSLTRICEVDYKAKTHKVYRHFTISTPTGVVENGVLTTSPEFVEELKNALAQNKVKAKQVVFTVTSGKIVSREVMIPPVKKNRVAAVVEAVAAEYFPVDLGQYELAYNIPGIVGEEKGSGQYKLLVMAAPRALLDGYSDLAKELNLNLAAIDYAGNSIFQVAKDKVSEGTSLIVKIDERSTLVMAVQNSEFSFTRSVPYGVDEAIRTVMDSTRWGNTDTVLKAMDVMSLNDCTVFPEFAAALRHMAGGISKIIDYYTSHSADASVEKIYITGIGADIRGMGEFLAGAVSLPVETLCRVKGWELEQSFGEQLYGGYIACVGAAAAPLGFMKDDRKKNAAGGRIGSIAAPVAFAVLGIGVVSATALAAFSTLQLMGARARNAELRAQYSGLEEIISIYDEYVATQTSYDLIKSMYSATENRNEELVEFLQELESKMPADVHVVSLSSSPDDVAISMTVSTKSEAAVAVEQLRTFESLYPASVTVNSVVENTDDETGETYVNFAVAALYRDMGSRPEEATDGNADENAAE